MSELGPLAQVIGLFLTGVLIPFLLMLRQESRHAIHNLANELQTMKNELHSVDKTLAALQATIMERDRIARILESRLPKKVHHE